MEARSTPLRTRTERSINSRSASWSTSSRRLMYRQPFRSCADPAAPAPTGAGSRTRRPDRWPGAHGEARSLPAPSPPRGRWRTGSVSAETNDAGSPHRGRLTGDLLHGGGQPARILASLLIRHRRQKPLHRCTRPAHRRTLLGRHAVMLTQPQGICRGPAHRPLTFGRRERRPTASVYPAHRPLQSRHQDHGACRRNHQIKRSLEAGVDTGHVRDRRPSGL